MPVYNFSKLMIQNPTENLSRRVVFLNSIMTTICDFSNGPMEKPDPMHTHPHEQISYVARGELLVFIDKEKYQLKEGDIFTVPSGLPHTIQTLTEYVRLIDSFSPIREELIKQCKT